MHSAYQIDWRLLCEIHHSTKWDSKEIGRDLHEPSNYLCAFAQKQPTKLMPHERCSDKWPDIETAPRMTESNRIGPSPKKFQNRYGKHLKRSRRLKTKGQMMESEWNHNSTETKTKSHENKQKPPDECSSKTKTNAQHPKITESNKNIKKQQK